MEKEINEIGYFGEFSGQYVDSKIEVALNEIASAYDKFKEEPDFQVELK